MNIGIGSTKLYATSHQEKKTNNNTSTSGTPGAGKNPDSSRQAPSALGSTQPPRVPTYITGKIGPCLTCLAGASLFLVQTRNTPESTAFGNPTGVLGSEKAPWLPPAAAGAAAVTETLRLACSAPDRCQG